MRGRARRGSAVVTAVLMASACARSAFAQIPQGNGAPDGNPPPESMRTVSVTIVAGGDDADPLVATVRELLGRVGLNVDAHVVATPSAGPEPAEAAGGAERAD